MILEYKLIGDVVEVHRMGFFIGKITQKGKHTVLYRCPSPHCGRKNWPRAYHSGLCAWCGFDLEDDEETRAYVAAVKKNDWKEVAIDNRGIMSKGQ